MGGKHSKTKREIDIDEEREYKFANKYHNFNEDTIPNDISWNNTVPFVAPINMGMVIKVYDGDTITVAAKLPMKNSPIYRFQVRLDGIDTPERKGKGVTKEEKEMAEEAKNALTIKIYKKNVILKDIKKEKYGRLLAKVFCDDECLNDWLVSERYAVKYDGGKKRSPKSWRKYKETGNML